MKGGDRIGRLTLTGNWERPLTLTLSPEGAREQLRNRQVGFAGWRCSPPWDRQKITLEREGQ